MVPAAIRLICSRVWIVFLLAPCAMFAATNSAWLTRVWQTEDGLPNNYVTSIGQSPDGYLWVATHMALAKFDGVRFTPFPFRAPNENDYQNQGARKVVPSRDGGIWITPMRGQAL